MEEEIQQPEPKISFAVGIIGTVVAVVFDLLSLVPFVGDIEEIPTTVIFIFNFIGGLGSATLVVQGVAMIIKLFPVAQELPLWTPAWLIMWYMESHPSALTAKLEAGLAIAGSLEGGLSEGEALEAGEGAAAAEAGTMAAETAEVGATTSAELAESEAVAGEAAEGEAESTNDKPSEKEASKSGKIREKIEDNFQGSGNEEKDEKEQKEEEVNREYEDLFPATEKNPIDVALQEEFGEQPFQQKQSQDKDENGEESKPQEKSPQEKLDDRLKRRGNVIEFPSPPAVSKKDRDDDDFAVAA